MEATGMELWVEITQEQIRRGEQILLENGIAEDEVSTVLQAIGYALMDAELYPEEGWNHGM